MSFHDMKKKTLLEFSWTEIEIHFSQNSFKKYEICVRIKRKTLLQYIFDSSRNKCKLKQGILGNYTIS